MLSYSLKTILRSWVREQAYLPSKSPLSLWLFSEGVKGSFLSVSRVFDSFGSREGVPFVSLAEALTNCGLGKSRNKLFLKFSNELHYLFSRVAHNARFFLCLENPPYKGLVFFLFFKQIAHKVPDLMNFLFGKPDEHLINIEYFHSLHIKMINNKQFLCQQDLNTRDRIWQTV